MYQQNFFCFQYKCEDRFFRKIPIIPVSIIAIILNTLGLHPTGEFKEFLKMGAYAGIVLQLFLLGTFLEGITIKEVHPKLFIGTLSQKFIMVPLLSAVILHFSQLDKTIQAIILMEMLTPLAVANINLASLYDCRPKDVTTLILISTLLFMPIVFVFEYIKTLYY